MSWQRPDWKRPELYPSIDNTSPSQWAWEFLRRNPEYESDYQLHLSKEAESMRNCIIGLIREACFLKSSFKTSFSEHTASVLERLLESHQTLLSEKIDHLSILPPAIANETVQEWLNRTDFGYTGHTSPINALCEKWLGTKKGLYLPNPEDKNAATGEHSRFFIFKSSSAMKGVAASYEVPNDCPELIALYRKQIKTTDHDKKIELNNQIFELSDQYRSGLRGDLPIEEISIKPQSLDELWLQFDLSKPVKSQLTIAKKFFLEQQEIYSANGGNVSKTKYLPKLYRDYLRVLDAYDRKIKKKEIAAQLFPSLENTHPGYAGDDRVFNFYSAALKLQENGYKNIPLSNT